MKKRTLIAVIAAIMGLVLLSGCDMITAGGNGKPSGGTEEKTPLEQVEEKYGKLPEAKKITQKIGITAGELVQYESEKTYTKAGSGYRVAGKEKRLNSLFSGSEEAYTERTVEETVKSGTFTVRLDLDELYFTTGPTFEGNVMEAGISDGSVETVFGIREELPEAVHGMTLRMVTDKEHVTGMEIRYSTGTSTVNITLKYEY